MNTKKYPLSYRPRTRSVCLAAMMALAVSAPALVQAQELLTTFGTGGDDLRGGNDNVHLVVLMRNGTNVRFENVNGLGRLADHTTHQVLRRLASGTRATDIAGVRLETTVSGGWNGDNWNLDSLQVVFEAAGARQTLFNQRGAPLFRFTGDARVRDFLFSVTPPARSGPVMTRFTPEDHGFKFINMFRNIFVSGLDIITDGLCGGMSWAAADYFRNGRTIPQQNFMPAEGTTLQSYIYNRQVDSVVQAADKWAEYGFNPFGWRNREFFNWGLQMGSGRLGELIASIDAGRPIPLGLQTCGNDCGCEGGCMGSHQVLAIGYELGRFNGDLLSFPEDVKIFVYDPNHPFETMTLQPHVAGAMYSYPGSPDERWRSYFVHTRYSPTVPPFVSANPSEIIAEFKTGGDDLRGGNDNVHMIVLLRDGREIRFNNVNDLRRWVNGSSQTIVRSLPDSIRAADVAGVRLETTFGGGWNGDNWNLDRLNIRVRIGGVTTSVVFREGTPFFRFTGSSQRLEVRR